MRKHRLLNKEIIESINQRKPGAGAICSSDISTSAKRVKTELDKVFDLIDDVCRDSWWFTDKEGRPWIDKEDVEYRGEDIYLVRFRCPIRAINPTYAFNRVVETVCKQLQSGIRYFCKEREEWLSERIRMFFMECAWIIWVGELAERRCPGDKGGGEASEDGVEGLSDEVSVGEMDERIAEAMENFL